LNIQTTAGGIARRLRDWFPDREFFMRSQGQVRFIKVSSRVQMIAAGTLALVLLAWAVTMGAMAWAQYRAQADRDSLVEREARVATSEERFDAYRGNIKAVTADLKRRQDVLEDMTQMLPDDVVTGAPVSNSQGEAAKTVAKVSMVFPEAAGLARIEARQLAFAEKLTRYADRRSARAVSAMRKLGLDPRAVLAAEQRQAMGGPLEKLSSGALDPRFERLGLSLARMDALERGLEGIPQFRPANVEMMTSSFGIRRDPFTGQAAMHSGLDFRGPIGAPIYAAAKGTVSFVGQINGYGNVVEISHGNGLMTRYAHMSKTHAMVGEPVEAGTVIGAIGSTGRSTGPHLHFEVRINGRAVNPRPFLEAAPDVLKEARGRPVAQLARR
jgi:murein DD-endopeptidase MepM/ murein hydrolase activator NlpD